MPLRIQKVKSPEKAISIIQIGQFFKLEPGKTRPQTILGNDHQGEHVTAYQLVFFGLMRAFDYATQTKVSGYTREMITQFFVPENREELRGKREKLLDFMSCVAALNPETRDDLYDSANTLYELYNNERIKKSKLQAKIEKIKSRKTDLKVTKAELAKVEKLLERNADALVKFELQLSRMIVNHYNHTPGITYPFIKKYMNDNGAHEGAEVQKILKAIEQKQVQEDEESADRADSTLTDIVFSTFSLFFYPEITDKDVLKKHIKDVDAAKRIKQATAKYNKKLCFSSKTAQARDNSEGGLIQALARHLFILQSVYPELKQPKFNFKKITKSFVTMVINGAGKNNGWPSFQSKGKISDIIKRVNKQLKIFVKEATKNSYADFLQNTDDLDASSEDEEFSTKLTKKEKNARKKLLTFEDFIIQAIANDEITLDEELMETIKNDYPECFQKISNSEQAKLEL